jgi:DegV family protein with EDD domain
MGQVALVTEVATSLPEELVRQYDITLVPLYLYCGDKTYREGIDITIEEVFQLMEKNSIRSSSTPPGEILETFRQLSQKTDKILYIAISTHMSTQFNVVMEIKEMAETELPQTNIEVISARTTIGGVGLTVLAAARAAAQGKDMAQVIEAADYVIERVTVLGAMNTLRYLVKFGRAGRTAHWATSLLNIKPIAEVPTTSGIPEPIERPRGRPQQIKRLLEITRSRVGDRPLHAIINHVLCLDEALKLKEQVAAQFNCVELYVSEYSPVAGMMNGPGTMALCFYAD